MSETSDSAEVETETKLHNVTANARTRAPTRGQRNEDRRKKEREKERVARGGREEDVCVRTRARIGDEDEPNAN